MVSAPVFQTSYVSSILTTRFMKIKFKNFWIWLKDQIKRKRFFFINFFITRNAWGAFSINSHINQHTNQPKITYGSVKSAQKAADAMSKKPVSIFHFTNVYFVTVITLARMQIINKFHLSSLVD